MKAIKNLIAKADKALSKANKACCEAMELTQGKLNETRGQGTVEYAILVGVLAVIAITAIMLFRESLVDLWNGISTGINGF